MALMDEKKKKPVAQYAFIGLIVASIACLSTGLLGVTKGLVAMQMFTPQNPGTLNLALQISIGILIVGLAAYAIMAPDKVRRFLTGRQARYGSNSLILTVAFFGIIFVANYIVYQNPKSWDLTQDKSHTLAPETLRALATLPGNVSATAYFTANLDTTNAKQILQDFKANSGGKFDYKFVNPDQDPVSARAAGITGDGKILLTTGDHKEIASSVSESELTKSLIRLINPNPRVVYFLEGHGESGIEAGKDLSFSVAADTLKSKNYTVNTLNLLVTNKIPDDALSIIIAGPKKPLSNEEVSLLKKYVDTGGSLFVMENPIILTEFGDSPDPLAGYLVKDWGITLQNDIIVDPSTQQPLNAVSAAYSSTHPITQNLSANYSVILPQARSIGIAETPLPNIQLMPLILTANNSWGETSLAANTQAEYNDGVDFKGPLNMAVAAENTTTKGRVVVFGNSLFAIDQNFDAYGNGNIFVNSLDWAAEQENLLNITPRTPITRSFVAPSPLALVIILIGSIIILPGLIVFAGISAWLARRKRG
jgi:ABC-type uncharacterized transport system involved in gliding motility auxiliary subunit